MDSILRFVLVVCYVVGSTVHGQDNVFSKVQKEKVGGDPGPKFSNADTSIGSGFGAGVGLLGIKYCNKFSEKVIKIARMPDVCKCKEGFVGSPPNCTIGPQLWKACYDGNPCGPDSECIMDGQYNRQCSCMPGFIGHPPNCQARHLRVMTCKDCGPNSKCDSYSSISSSCSCAAGFVGRPPNCTAGPTLLKCRDPYPCGPNSQCKKKDGVGMCFCLPGYYGEPPNCKRGPTL